MGIGMQKSVDTSFKHTDVPEGCAFCSLLNKLHQGEKVLVWDRKTVGQPVKTMNAKEFDLTI